MTTTFPPDNYGAPFFFGGLSPTYLWGRVLTHSPRPVSATLQPPCGLSVRPLARFNISLTPNNRRNELP